MALRHLLAVLSFSPQINVFLNDGDKEEDFKVKGNFLAKKYDVIQVLPGTRGLGACPACRRSNGVCV